MCETSIKETEADEKSIEIQELIDFNFSPFAAPKDMSALEKLDARYQKAKSGNRF